MKKLLIALALAGCVAGCTWEEVDKTSKKFQDGAAKAAEVGAVVSPIFGPWATLATVIAGAVGTVAGAVNTLAKNKKINALANTASEAAERVKGGGQALVNAAVGNGTAVEIKNAYDKLTVKPKA